MPISTQLRDNIIVSVWHGEIVLADMVQMLKALEDFEVQLPVAPDRLTDMSGAQVLRFLSGDMVSMAQSRQQAKLKNQVKSAIIATSPEQYGLARMFQAYNQNPDIHIMIFRERRPAYEWLGIELNSSDQPEA
jgi:polyhydroxyalkanoate synthesis regulator protein